MPFKPGQSGNPAGKKPGTKSKKLQLLESHSKKLLQKLIDLALAGDATALRLCIDRLLPRLRPERSPIRVNTNANDLVTQAEAIVQAALQGALPPDVARELTAALADVARLKEFTEIEGRIAALEERRDGPPWQRRKQLTNWEDDTAELLPIRGRRRRAK